jgi:metallo-beta-lactamase class B
MPGSRTLMSSSRRMPCWSTCISFSVFLMVGTANSQKTPSCPRCAVWNAPQQPFQIYGNTYYVGVKGLSAILITSKVGHVLIDGDSAESPPQIVASIRARGFRIEDVKLILNSHVHFDHAGGIAELQRLSGAEVAASPWSAGVMKRGQVGRGDPLSDGIAIAPIGRVKVVRDQETLSIGPIMLTSHFTPGHTPGGTSWTWESCEKSRCLAIVYADSLNAVSADGFSFVHSRDYPDALSDFEKSFKVIDALPCDILLTPHPEFADLIGKYDGAARSGQSNTFIDSTACKHYVEWERGVLRERIASESGKGQGK